MINPPLKDKYFSLDTAQLAVPNKDVEKLFIDFEIISGIAKELSAETQISADALYTANAIVNAVHMDRPATVAEGLALAADFFARRSTYGFADHEILATGHCHIDTAWLWPYDETKRKAARSWATQCGFMDLYPDYTFSCSQAQQYEWIEDNYPKLFKKITEKVESGNFIPIGGVKKKFGGERWRN